MTVNTAPRSRNRGHEVAPLVLMYVYPLKFLVSVWLGVAAIGPLSVLVAQVLPIRWLGGAGYVYGLIGVWKWWHGSVSAARRLRLAPVTPV